MPPWDGNTGSSGGKNQKIRHAKLPKLSSKERENLEPSMKGFLSKTSGRNTRSTNKTYLETVFMFRSLKWVKDKKQSKESMKSKERSQSW